MTLAPYMPIVSACKAAVLAYTKTIAVRCISHVDIESILIVDPVYITVKLQQYFSVCTTYTYKLPQRTVQNPENMNFLRKRFDVNFWQFGISLCNIESTVN